VVSDHFGVVNHDVVANTLYAEFAQRAGSGDWRFRIPGNGSGRFFRLSIDHLTPSARLAARIAGAGHAPVLRFTSPMCFTCIQLIAAAVQMQ
jgi:hypothetical protein